MKFSFLEKIISNCNFIFESLLSIVLAFVGGGGGEKKTPLKFCIPDSYIHEAEGEEEKEEKNIEWIEGISLDITKKLKFLST